MRWISVILGILLFSHAAYAVEEICGNMLDDDSTGGDLPCPSPDGDQDGYTTDGTGLGYDCDDTSYFMPAMPWTKDGCTGNQAKKCNTGTGAYGSCTTPTEGATNYYVHCDTGSDSNDCSFVNPCLSLLKFSQYFDPGDEPAGYLGFAANETVWLLGGTCTETYSFNGVTHPAFYSRQSGTSGNDIRVYGVLSNGMPAGKIDVSATCDGTPMCPAASLAAEPDYWDIRGIEFTGGTHDGTVNSEGGGIATDADNVRFYANWVHDNKGPNSSNPAGLNVSVAATNWDIAANRFNDNYDRAAGVSLNETQIDLFSGSGNIVRYNRIYNTAVTTDANNAAQCFRAKHGQASGGTEIHHNQFWNCREAAVGSGNSNTNMHHNLILDSDRWFFAQNFGGPTYTTGNIIEYNTAKNAGFAEYIPEVTTGNPADNIVRFNVYQDDDNAYGDEDSVWTLATYGTDALYTTWWTGGANCGGNTCLEFETNCYYNSAATALNFCVWCSESGAQNLGTDYNFAGWQGQGRDDTGFNENPLLDQYHRATSTNCDDWGWLTVPVGGGGGNEPDMLLLEGKLDDEQRKTRNS